MTFSLGFVTSFEKSHEFETLEQDILLVFQTFLKVICLTLKQNVHDEAVHFSPIADIKKDFRNLHSNQRLAKKSIAKKSMAMRRRYMSRSNKYW